MLVLTDEVFNRSYYEMLSTEDRIMIDEYVAKMSPSDINSFMRRLIEHYEAEDALEVLEEKDSVVVFETNTKLSKIRIDNIKLPILRKIPYEYIVKYFRNYFKNYTIKTKYIELAINKYFKSECSITKEWMPDKRAKKYVMDICLDLMDADGGMSKINNIKLPIRLYTYRINKKRMGIAVDKNVLETDIGYSPNFKMAKVQIKYVSNNKQYDLTSFVRNSGYWTPKNAKKHGFDNRTGVIWFNGKLVDENRWQLPNGIIINNDSDIYASFIYATDAFSKMFQRFDFDSKIKQLILQLNL